MPFGHWTTFNACVVDMMGDPNNYDSETAEKTCGKLQARLEGKEQFKLLKSLEGRRVVAQYVHVEGMDKERDIIPNHRIGEALDSMKTWDTRYQNVNWRHRSYQIGHPLWRYVDEDGVVHKTEVDEYGLWGITEVRNDGYQMADRLWKLMVSGVPMGASIAVQPQGKPVIVSQELVLEKKWKQDRLGAKYWDVPMTFVEPWSFTQVPANQYVTAASILSKSECLPCVEARADWYIRTGVYRSDQYVEALEHSQSYFLLMKRMEEKVEFEAKQVLHAPKGLVLMDPSQIELNMNPPKKKDEVKPVREGLTDNQIILEAIIRKYFKKS